MKITSVECYLADGGLGGFVTVKVNTDEGISGFGEAGLAYGKCSDCLLYTSPSPRDRSVSRMPSSA